MHIASLVLQMGWCSFMDSWHRQACRRCTPGVHSGRWAAVIQSLPTAPSAHVLPTCQAAGVKPNVVLWHNLLDCQVGERWLVHVGVAVCMCMGCGATC